MDRHDQSPHVYSSHETAESHNRSLHDQLQWDREFTVDRPNVYIYTHMVGVLLLYINITWRTPCVMCFLYPTCTSADMLLLVHTQYLLDRDRTCMYMCACHTLRWHTYTRHTEQHCMCPQTASLASCYTALHRSIQGQTSIAMYSHNTIILCDVAARPAVEGGPWPNVKWLWPAVMLCDQQ